MTFEEIRFIIQRTAEFLGDFFVGRGDVEQLGGPVKVARVSGEVATLGVVALINLTALLSLNIGISIFCRFLCSTADILCTI
jgi:regulator of sigma E protease